MKRFFIIFAGATALAVGVSATTWSQTGGAGGAGTAGSAGTSSSAGTAGTPGTTGGTAGTTGVGTTRGKAGTTGTAGTSATPGTAGATNRAGAAGTAGIGTDGTPGLGRGTARATGRANANAGLNNAAARANLNDQTMVSRTPFFTDPGVRQQLNLNDTQFNSLNKAHQNAYIRYNQAINNLNPNLTPEQRMLQMQQFQAQFNQDLTGTVNSTLTNPQVVSRFNQLNRQFMGFNAFNDPTVRRQLNLTPEQVRQLRTLSNNWRQQLQQFRRGAGNDLQTVDQSQWNQLQQQYAAQLNGVLTPEQQQLWAQQTGQPHMFSPNVYLGEQQAGNIVVDNPPIVDPTVPKYFPDGSARSTTPQGTQAQPGTSQPATQGTATPGTASQGGTQGTVR